MRKVLRVTFLHVDKAHLLSANEPFAGVLVDAFLCEGHLLALYHKEAPIQALHVHVRQQMTDVI